MTEAPMSRRRMKLGELVVRHHSPYCEATGPIVEKGTVSARVRALQEAYKKDAELIRSHTPQRHRPPCTRHSVSEGSSDLEQFAPAPIRPPSRPSRRPTKTSIHVDDTKRSDNTSDKTMSFTRPGVPTPFLQAKVQSIEGSEAQTPNISALLEEMMETDVTYMEDFTGSRQALDEQASRYEVVDPWGPSAPIQYSALDNEIQSSHEHDYEAEDDAQERFVDFTKPVSMYRKSIADQLGQMIDEALEKRTSSTEQSEITRRYRSRSTSSNTAKHQNMISNQEPPRYTESTAESRPMSQVYKKHQTSIVPGTGNLDLPSKSRGLGRRRHRRSTATGTILPNSVSDSSPVADINYPITNRYIMTKAIPPSHNGLDYHQYDRAHHPRRESTGSYFSHNKKSARIFPVLRSRRSVQGTADAPKSHYAGSIFVHNFQRNGDVIEEARRLGSFQSHQPREIEHKKATRRLSRPWRWWRLTLMDKHSPNESLRSGPEIKLADQTAERTPDLDSNEAEVIEEIVNVLSHYTDHLSTPSPPHNTQKTISTSRSMSRLGRDTKQTVKETGISPVELQPMNVMATSWDGSSDTHPSTEVSTRKASLGFRSAQATPGDAPTTLMNGDASGTSVDAAGGGCQVNIKLTIENTTVEMTIENAANTNVKVEFHPKRP